MEIAFYTRVLRQKQYVLQTPDGHINQVPNIQRVLYTLMVSLQLKKFVFFTNCIDELGHVICRSCLEIPTGTIDEMNDLQTHKAW